MTMKEGKELLLGLHWRRKGITTVYGAIFSSRMQVQKISIIYGCFYMLYIPKGYLLVPPKSLYRNCASCHY